MVTSRARAPKGGDIIGMLEFIHEETVKEGNTSHKDGGGERSQADYEDCMTDLKKKKEAFAEKRLMNVQESLAEAKRDLLEAQENLKETTVDKVAIEEYLKKSEPGSDSFTLRYLAKFPLALRLHVALGLHGL